MSKYSVEISHYMITYYKNTIIDPDTGEEKVENNKTVTDLIDLNRSVDFDDFISGIRWIDGEIVDILGTVWKNLPGKHVYLSKTTLTVTLDIKLSNCGYPKTVYRAVYDYHRIDAAPRDCPFPVSDEERALLDRLGELRKEFRNEVNLLRNDGLLSIIESRRVISYYFKIVSAIKSEIYAGKCGDSWDKIANAYNELLNLTEDFNVSNTPISVVCKDSSNPYHIDKITEIVDKIYDIVWDVDHLGKSAYGFAISTINAINRWKEYTIYTINQNLLNS